MSDAITVTWINRDESRTTAQVPIDRSLMEAALANGIVGIVGDCGGALACATCHVIVEESPVAMARPTGTEAEMLDFAEAPATASSRLSCQIRATRELDGIVLRVPVA